MSGWGGALEAAVIIMYMPEGQSRQIEPEPHYWLRRFMVGGIAVGGSLFLAAGYAGLRAEDSQNKALKIFQEDGIEMPRAPQLSEEFIDQNNHTRGLGEAEHYLRMASAGVLLVTVAGGAGFSLGANQQRFRVTEPEGRQPTGLNG